MRKKFLCFLVVVMFLCGAECFAGTAFGVQYGFVPSIFGPQPKNYLSVTFKTARIPFVFAARMGFDEYHLSSIGLVTDMWLRNPAFGSSVLRYYYGPGLTLMYSPQYNEDDFSQDWQVFAAPRFFGGVNMMLTGSMELYGQAAVEPGVVFDIEDGLSFRMQFPLEAGMRFWF